MTPLIFGWAFFQSLLMHASSSPWLFFPPVNMSLWSFRVTYLLPYQLNRSCTRSPFTAASAWLVSIVSVLRYYSAVGNSIPHQAYVGNPSLVISFGCLHGIIGLKGFRVNIKFKVAVFGLLLHLMYHYLVHRYKKNLLLQRQ